QRKLQSRGNLGLASRRNSPAVQKLARTPFALAEPVSPSTPRLPRFATVRRLMQGSCRLFTADKGCVNCSLHRAAGGLSFFRQLVKLFDAAVTHFEATNPEQNVFGDVGGVIRDAFEVARGQDEVQVRSGERGILAHAQK